MDLRSIKFKAKSIYNGEWVYGDLLHQSDGTHIYMGKGEGGHILCPRVDPSTVCQFTGLKDSKGQEIWEGDILAGELKCEIAFTKGAFVTHNICEGKVYSYPLCYFVKEDGTVDSKVIGNKFDKEK